MSQEDTVQASSDDTIKLTEQLLATFKTFLHMFMLQQKMSNFGPNDHVHRFEPETGIYVSYVMTQNGNIQMTTTVPFETLNKYMSFSGPTPEETVN